MALQQQQQQHHVFHDDSYFNHENKEEQQQDGLTASITTTRSSSRQTTNGNIGIADSCTSSGGEYTTADEEEDGDEEEGEEHSDFLSTVTGGGTYSYADAVNSFDFTLPISNKKVGADGCEGLSMSPPLHYVEHHRHHHQNQGLNGTVIRTGTSATASSISVVHAPRRNVFARTVQKRYNSYGLQQLYPNYPQQQQQQQQHPQQRRSQLDHHQQQRRPECEHLNDENIYMSNNNNDINGGAIYLAPLLGLSSTSPAADTLDPHLFYQDGMSPIPSPPMSFATPDLPAPSSSPLPSTTIKENPRHHKHKRRSLRGGGGGGGTTLTTSQPQPNTKSNVNPNSRGFLRRLFFRRSTSSFVSFSSLSQQQQQQQQHDAEANHHQQQDLHDDDDDDESLQLQQQNNPSSFSCPSSNKCSSIKQPRAHETLHAQSLLLGLVFCAIWTPSNMMAPNLTEMALDFGLKSAEERDLYLGSYCALATGVFSFPIAAGLGILADFYSRQKLFVLTALGGALSAFLTARAAQTFWQLFLLRLANGGFMAASVPIAFSLLADLFDTNERNAASSGLTAFMGLGIVCGQVYAGISVESMGWEHAFNVSAAVTIVLAVLCFLLVQEPERGGKERVLQDMIRSGTRYERKLTWRSFWHAMQHNKSNSILLWQGFFSSLPWGIIFVFLNDYLSQERGFSVPDATFLVFLFGVGCTLGGVLGGYWGQVVLAWDRSYLPIFMALTTALGIAPFIGLLNTHFTNARGLSGFIYSISAGLVASLPSVNVRPCLLNVNPPETRGASLTAANLLINLGRGVGPSCVTLLVSTFRVDRQTAFNITLILFWLISAIQLLFLAKTLPDDQDSMEAELVSYALQVMVGTNNHDQSAPPLTADDSFVSIEDRRTSFDGTAARQTFLYVSEGIKEIKLEMSGNKLLPCRCLELESSSEESSAILGGISPSAEEEEEEYATIWRLHQREEEELDFAGGDLSSILDVTDGRDNESRYPDETTPLMH